MERSKNKIFESYEKGLNSKRIKVELFETINKAPIKWLLNLRSKNIPVNSLLLKEKASDYVKELGVPIFQASDGLLEKWKKSKFILSLKIYMLYRYL